MRVPVPSQLQQQTTTTAGHTLKPIPPTTPNYEPTSVLDLHSPIADKTAATAPPEAATAAALPPSSADGPIHWDDHVLQNLDWDSIMTDLGLQEDSSAAGAGAVFDPTPYVPSDFPLSDMCAAAQQGGGGTNSSFDLVAGGWSFGFDFLEELIQAASCVDSGELQLAQVILARLNQRLRSPAAGGKPLQRAAFYFKEALQSFLVNSAGNNSNNNRLSTWHDIVQTIKSYKAFSVISLIPMFTHFTANQALLETLDGAPYIHVVDFEIGLGGQYASLMREIAERGAARGSHAPALRVTAVVPEEYAIETRLIRENLSQFAGDLNLRFSIDFVLLRAFDMLSFKAVEFVDGESLAVHLSPAILHRLGSAAGVSRFLGDVRRLSPKVVVFVNSEPWGTDSGAGAGSFRRSFVSCFEYYTTVFESLDAAVGGAGGDWPRKIEAYLLQPRIQAALEAAAAAKREAMPGREAFHAAGMRAVQLSQFADFQAECLLGQVQVRGFHVAKRQGELLLYWHDRALVATSAWRF